MTSTCYRKIKRNGKSRVTENRTGSALSYCQHYMEVCSHCYAPITLISAEDTPWNRILHQALTVAHMVKILSSCLLGDSTFQQHVRRDGHGQIPGHRSSSISLRHTLILSSHLRLCLANCPSGFPTKIPLHA